MFNYAIYTKEIVSSTIRSNHCKNEKIGCIFERRLCFEIGLRLPTFIIIPGIIVVPFVGKVADHIQNHVEYKHQNNDVENRSNSKKWEGCDDTSAKERNPKPIGRNEGRGTVIVVIPDAGARTRHAWGTGGKTYYMGLA